MRASLPGVLLLMMLCLLPATLAAQEWDSLDADVRALLEPIRPSWDKLPDADVQRILASASAWLAAEPEQRQALRDRYTVWMSLSPQERAAARQRRQAWEALDEAQRALLGASARSFAQQPASAQERARERFAALPPDARLAYLLPAEQREAAAMAQRLFPFVGEGEREASLAMLAGLGKEGRARFEQVARRMSPQQRDALRSRLLALPADQRSVALDAN